jgi:DNA-binding beta-propeller fold protein YncE
MDRMKKQRGVLILSCLALSFLITTVSCVSLVSLIGKPASYVWVMDAGDFKNETYLIKMCPTGKRLSQIQFGQSGEIDIDPRTNIVWASEMGDVDNIHFEQVVQVDHKGNIIDRFQGYPSPLMAVDPRDGSVWLTTWNPMEQQGLLAKIASNGKLIRKVGGFSSPYAAELDPRDGSLWVADGGSRTLIHISADGEKLFEMRIPGYFFSNAPDQLAIEPESGNLWFTTAGPGMLHKISPEGTVLFETGGFSSPVAVTINPINGNVWVADFDLFGSGGIVKFSPGGEALFTQALPAHAETAAINPFDGMLWVGVKGELIRYSDDGNVVGWEPGFRHPGSIAFAQSGDDLLTEVRCTLAFYADLFR